MKKLIVIATLLVGVFSNQVSAQSGGVRVAAGDITGDGSSEKLSINHTRVEGTNTVKLPDGKGTLKFRSTGNTYSDVVYTDAAGKSTRLNPMPGGSAGAPKPQCNFPLPNACFGAPTLNIAMCMCRPTNLSAAGGGDPTAILIALLVPAVQKIREAGH